MYALAKGLGYGSRKRGGLGRQGEAPHAALHLTASSAERTRPEAGAALTLHGTELALAHASPYCLFAAPLAASPCPKSSAAHANARPPAASASGSRRAVPNLSSRRLVAQS